MEGEGLMFVAPADELMLLLLLAELEKALALEKRKLSADWLRPMPPPPEALPLLPAPACCGACVEDACGGGMAWRCT
jgi:hypothetical protein